MPRNTTFGVAPHRRFVFAPGESSYSQATLPNRRFDEVSDCAKTAHSESCLVRYPETIICLVAEQAMLSKPSVPDNNNNARIRDNFVEETACAELSTSR